MNEDDHVAHAKNNKEFRLVINEAKKNCWRNLYEEVDENCWEDGY